MIGDLAPEHVDIAMQKLYAMSLSVLAPVAGAFVTAVLIKTGCIDLAVTAFLSLAAAIRMSVRAD
jgi:hypothetical protein